MKKGVLVSFLVFFAVQAHATLLTFDDIPGGSLQGGTGALSTTYKGFNFASTAWVDLWGLVLQGQPVFYGAHSGEFGAWVTSIPHITAHSGADFTFGGLWAKAWKTPIESGGPDKAAIGVYGYLDGVYQWSSGSTGLNGSYEFIGGQAGVVDEIRLLLSSQVIIDDLDLTEMVVQPPPESVPEPGSLALLALGMAGLGLARRKKTAW